MWFYLGVIISIILLLSGCSNSKKDVEVNYGIPWEKDLKTAFTKAKKENKKLLIMAVSKGCRWCEKMKKETLSNRKVAKRLEKYILVKADRETSSERDQLPPFKHVPIIFFMTPDKEVIDNLRGYFEPEDFLEYITELEDD